VALQGRLVGHGLGNVAFARAWLANDQRILTFGNEFEGM
jgi:hypothetical protein